MQVPQLVQVRPPRCRTFGSTTCRILASAALLLAMAHASAETITVGGTGAALGTMRALAVEFAKVTPGASVVVVPNLGSSGGLKALAAGAIDMAAIARPLNQVESAQGIVAMAYGKNPFVIATSMKGAGTVRTLAELADMYAGRRTAWEGGEPIRLVLRPRLDTDTVLLESFSPELKLAMPAALARPGMIVASTDQETAETIEKTPGAIGPSSLALIRTEARQVRVLPLNGITPSARTVADGSYPYFKAMFLARKGAGTPAVALFFDFVASPRGRQILVDTGHAVAEARAAGP